jgi:two-component system OmpR family response regulator
MKRSACVVAIVDDDSRVVESLESFLDSAGHSAHGFTSAQALLDSSVWNAMDVLITDIDMPWLDGFALYRRLKIDRPCTSTIFITGCMELFREAERLAGPDVPVFFKPFDPTELLRSIADRKSNG